MHLLRIVDGERTFIEWSVALDTVPDEADSWRTLLMSWIPNGPTLCEGRWNWRVMPPIRG